MSEDPFFIVKREVESSLKEASELYSLWTNNLGSSSESSLKIQANQIRDLLRNILADLDELDETIKVVQTNPAKFKLEKRDVDERKEFVSATRKKVEQMRKTIQNPAAAKMGGEAGMRNALLTSKSSSQKPSAGREEDYKMSNQRFIEREQMQQQMVMDQQDRQVEEVAVTVGNLKEIARVMGDELDDQTRLLGEVETQVDNTSNRLQDGIKRVQEFIKANSDTRQQWCVAVLIVVLVLLIVLVIYI